MLDCRVRSRYVGIFDARGELNRHSIPVMDLTEQEGAYRLTGVDEGLGEGLA
jgi:hypothetical protein